MRALMFKKSPSRELAEGFPYATPAHGMIVIRFGEQARKMQRLSSNK